MDKDSYPTLTVADLISILIDLPPNMLVTHLAHRDDSEESGLTAARVPIRRVMLMGYRHDGYVRLEGIDLDYGALPVAPDDISELTA